MMKYPNSIITQVYKAKYFRNCDILDAGLNHSPSLAWRSIWGAKALLKEGILWQIGNGKHVRIWEDKWLTQSLTTPCPANYSNKRVLELIDVTNAAWNEDLIKSLFNHTDAELIMKVPLSAHFPNDKTTWAYTSSGLYSVKSGYWLGRKMGLSVNRICW